MKSRERHELKTDKFAETMMALGMLLNKYRREVTVFTAVVVVVVLGVLWFWRSKASKAEDLWRRVNDVEENLATAAPERKTKEAYDMAIVVLKAIKDEAGESSAGFYALLKAGDVQFEERDFASAANTYRQILNDPKAPEVYKQFATDSLGPALEQAGKWEEAIAFYKTEAAGKSIVQSGNGSTVDKQGEAAQLYWSMGRCYEQFGNAEEAAKARQEVIKLAPNSPWAQMARVDTALMPQSGPKPESSQPKPEEKPTEAPSAPVLQSGTSGAAPTNKAEESIGPPAGPVPQSRDKAAEAGKPAAAGEPAEQPKPVPQSGTKPAEEPKPAAEPKSAEPTKAAPVENPPAPPAAK